MKAVKVEYTTTPEYVEENKKNIKKVMDLLKANPIEGMQYSSYTDEENPNHFIHINMAKDQEAMSKLNDIPEFKEFQVALKSSGLVSPPKATKLNLVGMGFSL